MSPSKNILFITWDSGKTSYLENLFLPIFEKIQEQSSYRFVIMQYSWASNQVIAYRADLAKQAKIKYVPKILKNNSRSKAIALIKASSEIHNCVKLYNINYVMPRSIWPAAMVTLSKIKLPIIYDADGLAVLEKKEFGVSESVLSLMHRIEKYIAKKSKVILTRSQYASNWLSTNYGLSLKKTIVTIPNGVSRKLFYYNPQLRAKYRLQLNLNDNDILFIYVGSLGNKYAVKETITLFNKLNKRYQNSKLIILTSHLKELKQILNEQNSEAIIYKNIPHIDINAYLNAADIGLCFIKPTESIKGVNPIKLNEYLMSGLPVIINGGIGDTRNFIDANSNCLLVDYHNMNNVDTSELNKLLNFNRQFISDQAFRFCSLQATAKAYLHALDKLSN